MVLQFGSQFNSITIKVSKIDGINEAIARNTTAFHVRLLSDLLHFSQMIILYLQVNMKVKIMLFLEIKKSFSIFKEYQESTVLHFKKGVKNFGAPSCQGG